MNRSSMFVHCFIQCTNRGVPSNADQFPPVDVQDLCIIRYTFAIQRLHIHPLCTLDYLFITEKSNKPQHSCFITS